MNIINIMNMRRNLVDPDSAWNKSIRRRARRDRRARKVFNSMSIDALHTFLTTEVIRHKNKAQFKLWYNCKHMGWEIWHNKCDDADMSEIDVMLFDF